MRVETDVLCYCGRSVRRSIFAQNIASENASFDGAGKPALLPFPGDPHHLTSAWDKTAAEIGGTQNLALFHAQF